MDRGLVETYGIMVMRALRHRGDGGKLIGDNYVSQ